MSYVIEDHNKERRVSRSSTALKGFFGFAIVALVAVNVSFGFARIELSDITQLIVALVGGLIGFGIAQRTSKDSSD